MSRDSCSPNRRQIIRSTPPSRTDSRPSRGFAAARPHRPGTMPGPDFDRGKSRRRSLRLRRSPRPPPSAPRPRFSRPPPASSIMTTLAADTSPRRRADAHPPWRGQFRGSTRAGLRQRQGRRLGIALPRVRRRHRRHRVRKLRRVHPHHARHERASDCADPDALDDPRPRAMPSSDAGSRPRTVDLARAGHCRHWLARQRAPGPAQRQRHDGRLAALDNLGLQLPWSPDQPRCQARQCARGVAPT